MSAEDLAAFADLRFHTMLVAESNDLVQNVLKYVIRTACTGAD